MNKCDIDIEIAIISVYDYELSIEKLERISHINTKIHS